ncbi:MAG: glycosyltransferase [Elusimicrobia bacterium]|nr:glycosyltransferase [Elusimicrobiota bacterium]
MCRRGSALEKEARLRGLAVMNLPFLGEWDPVSALKLRRAAESAETDAVLHAHTGHTAALAVLASKAGGPPCVVHRRVDFKLSGLLSRRLKYQAAGRVIAVSGAIGRLLEDQGMPPEKIAVVPDAIPADAAEAKTAGAEAFSPASPAERASLRARLAEAWKADAEAPWIGNVAALVPHKDQANFLKAAAVVAKRRPNAVFWIVGEGPLRAELETLARRLGLGASVRFTGSQPRPQDWLRTLDVFALSSWGEGMGSVLLEALACGAPIAATTAGGIPEVVEDDRTALLVPPRDPEALGGAIARLLQEPPLARKLASAGLGQLERFSLAENADAVLKIYETVGR